MPGRIALYTPAPFKILKRQCARVAELVDAVDSKSTA